MLAQLQRQQRDEQILLSLDKLTYATREQLQIINNLGGDRNAQRILARMEKDKLLLAARLEKKIYYLSNKGKQLIGSTQGNLNKKEVTHALMRNDLYIKLGMPSDWKKERPVTWGGNKLIPDATFKRNGEFYFIEIDNQQTMAANIDKIKKYKDLSYIIHQQYNHRPTLIWYTLFPTRKKKLKELCEKLSIKYEIYGNM
ncbi:MULTISPECIES: replication-relaxation family protein [unclassified Oceanobacillus]|uniref:replication-relaxation family protein n=1 Tax=unclassified Oceanobacillus TaxID=2630292 RepID=UPI001BEC8DA7|nr:MULTISPECIES: replication-relaxation family protein [unclassified Oceanobacillus]MBT2600924.1 replication-relaxation family protein [Oceanobacillus sp. ISL-74]MBT2653625.1 replication-relaxation family protein [Oceanobacillus sp. ISL-73]